MWIANYFALKWPSYTNVHCQFLWSAVMQTLCINHKDKNGISAYLIV